MNAEKASTLRLLREGIGNTVKVLESKGGATFHEVRAHLPDCSESSMIPVLFLLTSLAFLEASAESVEGLPNPEYNEVDGWTPADFLSHLRFDGRKLLINLDSVRGRRVQTTIVLKATGDLVLKTVGRGQSAARWLGYVQGRAHLREVND